jgi:hypothetical protein
MHFHPCSSVVVGGKDGGWNRVAELDRAPERRSWPHATIVVVPSTSSLPWPTAVAWRSSRQGDRARRRSAHLLHSSMLRHRVEQRSSRAPSGRPPSSAADAIAPAGRPTAKSLPQRAPPAVPELETRAGKRGTEQGRDQDLLAPCWELGRGAARFVRQTIVFLIRQSSVL